MKKEEIRQVFDDVEQRLDALQGSGASFMFIGHQGDHFVLDGRTDEICGTLLLVMMNYPAFRDIIKECAERYDELEAMYCGDVREAKMDHLIEQNSGK